MSDDDIAQLAEHSPSEFLALSDDAQAKLVYEMTPDAFARLRAKVYGSAHFHRACDAAHAMLIADGDQVARDARNYWLRCCRTNRAIR